MKRKSGRSASKKAISLPTGPATLPLGATKRWVQETAFFPSFLGERELDAALAAASACGRLYARGQLPKLLTGLVSSDADATSADREKELVEASLGVARVANAVGAAFGEAQPMPGFAAAMGIVATAEARGKEPKPALPKAKDVLVLTGAIGTGIAMLAAHHGARGPEYRQRVLDALTLPPKDAGEVLVTKAAKLRTSMALREGGLIAPLAVWASEAKLKVRLELEAVPLMEETPSLAAEGLLPESATETLELLPVELSLPEGLPPEVPFVLASSEVNGAALLVVPPTEVKSLVRAMEKAGAFASVIGRFERGAPGIEVA